jgi:hypothetical protein
LTNAAVVKSDYSCANASDLWKIWARRHLEKGDSPC